MCGSLIRSRIFLTNFSNTIHNYYETLTLFYFTVNLYAIIYPAV